MNILVFAPHPDDEVLGCGGIIAKLAAAGNPVTVCVVTSGKPPLFDDAVAIENGWPDIHYPEVKASHDVLGVTKTVFLQNPAANLEMTPRYMLNEQFCEVVDEACPDIVFIPHFGDMQRDHALVAEAAMVAVRPRGEHIIRKVYAYETLSETEWNTPHVATCFLPNTFVDIEMHLPKKIEAMACYHTQLSDFPAARSLEAIEALAKLRGSTMGSKAAEAFVLIREYDFRLEFR